MGFSDTRCRAVLSAFDFQQFSVIQNRSAMKVCTDATLFGAMAPVCGGESVLDIGSGTGLLSLMLAQLGAGRVDAVELEQGAFEESRANFAASPWSDRLRAFHQDIQAFARESGSRYDLVISNPPFFENHSRTEGRSRNTARHADTLSYAELIEAVDLLLQRDGLFYLLLPTHAVERFAGTAEDFGLHPLRRIDIRGYVHNRPKVSALTFVRGASGRGDGTLMTIYREHRVYSSESEPYLRPFLLRFAES
jgi:tRNA1Val (adenine37-N6)-methyltransferase